MLLRMHLQDYGDVLVVPLVRRHGVFPEARRLRSCDRPHWRIDHHKVKQGATMGV